MNFLNIQDVQDIIEELDMPCKDSEALLHDLNYWIVERGFLSDKLPLNTNQQKKNLEEISQKNKTLHESRLGCLEGALNTIIFRSEKMLFSEQTGIEKLKISHAKEVLEALITLEMDSVKNIPMAPEDFKPIEHDEKRYRPAMIFKYEILPTLFEEHFGAFKNYASQDHSKMSSGIKFIKLVMKKSANIHLEAGTISKGYQRHQEKRGH